mgnify:FL=1
MAYYQEARMVKPAKSHGLKRISLSDKPKSLITSNEVVNGAWNVQVITLFPDAFPGVLGLSLTGKALQCRNWTLSTIDLRDFGIGKHNKVDDTPSGGGPGLVIRADVLGPAIETALSRAESSTPLVYLSPRGKTFNQRLARKWSKSEGIILICGRFEGIDQRVIDHYGIEEVSMGDFVMTGGEIAAQAMIDTTVRLLPNVIGNRDSLKTESHSNGLIEHDQFTRPNEWKGQKIPQTLSSGHHGKIESWRENQSKSKTKQYRADLWEKANLAKSKS